MKHLRQLQDEKYTLVQNDTDLASFVDMVGLNEFADDITGMVVEIIDGDLGEVWITEDAAYYDLSAVYHPLSFYR